jgi:hypothetical protein
MHYYITTLSGTAKAMSIAEAKAKVSGKYWLARVLMPINYTYTANHKYVQWFEEGVV